MKTLPVIDRPSWLPESAWPWPTYALDHDSGRIAVTDIGAGPPLLFVHVGSWSFVWRDVLLRLQHDFRCVTLDAPGSGLSDRSKSAPTLARAGDAVAAVVDELQLRDLTLIAHDLGGPAGFLAASRRADRVAALVAVNCFAWRPSGALFRGMLAAMGSASARELDAAIGWLASAANRNRFRCRSPLEPSGSRGLPRRDRPLGPARLARLLPGCPPSARAVRRARCRAARTPV
jgi:pimeloyl-ACP methyl ester carboxylesterase